YSYLVLCVTLCFCFFFQAEDGIRYFHVTGIQTCALPIYTEDPKDYLQRTFEEVAGYDEMILLKGIPFVSHCEHHMAPIIGHAHEIGRASCRERVEKSEVDGCL